MAIAITSAGIEVYVSDTGSEKTIFGYTPAANNLILVPVISDSKYADNSGATSVTHPSLTFSKIGSTDTDGTRITNMFGAISGASPSSGTLTISFNGVDQYYAMISVDHVSGADIGGTVANAIVQRQSGAGALITLSAFASADNAAYGQFFNTSTFSVGGGFTQLGALLNNASTRWSLTEWKLNDNTVDVSAGTYGQAIEIKAGGVTGAATPALELTIDLV